MVIYSENPLEFWYEGAAQIDVTGDEVNGYGGDTFTRSVFSKIPEFWEVESWTANYGDEEYW